MLGKLGLTSKLFGQDPKLTFSTSPRRGVALLASSSRIPKTDSAYWTQYFTLFDSLSDLITLVDANSLNKATEENLKTLVEVTCDRLFELLGQDRFPKRPNQGGGSLLEGFTAALSGDDDDDARQAINCVRVLTRVVPYLTRPGPDGTLSDLESDVFWKPTRVRVRKNSSPSATTSSASTKVNEDEADGEAGHFVLEDEDDDDEEVDTSARSTANCASRATDLADQSEWHQVPPLAERLLAALVDLAFVPGLTVPEECRAAEGGSIAYVIWEAGIANPSSSSLPPSPLPILSARLEVLRLLNILFSVPSLVTPPHLFPVIPNRWRQAFVSSSINRKVVLCFLCSILNTALNAGLPSSTDETDAPPQSPSKGKASALLGAASGAAGIIGGAVMRLGAEDVRGLLVSACLQSLSILLAQHHIPSSDPVTEQSPRQSEVNSFAYYVSKLHRTSDFDLVVRGVLHVLDQATNESALAIPRTVVGALSGATGRNTTTRKTTSVNADVTNALIVLWRMLDLNPKLWKWVFREKEELSSQLIVLLVAFCLEYKDDETQLGVVRLSAFMLQSISAEPGLSARWNAPVEMKLSLRSKYGVPGTLADFLVVSIYTLVFTTKGKLAPLYPTLVLSITNASPHFKQLSTFASTRLTQLFLAFSAPNFLLMEEGNPRLVYYLLEAFNNVIHHQLSDNPELIYAILRSHQRFDELSKFTLEMGVAEARRLKAERKLKKAAVMAHTEGEMVEVGTRRRSSSTSGATEEGDELSEKQRGKRRQRGASLETISVADLSLGPTDSSVPEGTNETDPLESTRASEDQSRRTSLDAGDFDEDAPFVGKNGFVPGEAWVASWREGLPLDSILIAISELRPLILDLPARPPPSSTQPVSSSSTAIGLLSSASLAGLLPPAPSPKSRAFIFNPQSTTWLASICYGNQYLAAYELLRDVPVALFAVAPSARSRSTTMVEGVRGAVERVGRGWRAVV
ncbi:BZ3500_MvSof-1268-A1-R1_Chr8-2g10280 [Microbotryum saponariae]|uniref:BZ3500_MvSof-1268-A1-R1_Chr8-2g10280 protein n=1 Tax=Microbotryum saponariae TaxID=289078 RepID=A0A2X0LC54_9BASI|nr:BZ3500_MvSof-1268-A1-R1_Chr8-2g10280 [Microbotryum saponariae]SDA02088.1 BZ3501_MvSof-1269-A2-R1_Chr8-2g10030 [Microbotryum saponariae]